MEIQTAINSVIEGQNLSSEQMYAVMQSIMTGEATSAQIAGFLVALRMKGETVEEIAAAVDVMRGLATPVEVGVPDMIDIVGTGGDGAKIFNVSTASSFVAAAAGCHVAKHGNRSVSSSSGSADLLETAGINLSMTPEQVARAIEEVGLGFMFAVNHHGAMKHAIGPRKELATRTIFNLLGPMTNPAGVKRQLLGVFDAKWLRPIAEVLMKLGSEHVVVVHSCDGLDEVSVAAKTFIVELKENTITEYEVAPEDFGITSREISSLSVTNSDESLDLIKEALEKDNNKSERAELAADMIALNAGFAIYVSGQAPSPKHGVEMAKDIIATGQALEKMRELAQFSELLSNSKR